MPGFLNCFNFVCEVIHDQFLCVCAYQLIIAQTVQVLAEPFVDSSRNSMNDSNLPKVASVIPANEQIGMHINFNIEVKTGFIFQFLSNKTVL